MAEEAELQPLESFVMEYMESLGPGSRQLLAGGLAGCVAKTAVAPLSRLTILFQVHSMVTTKSQQPQFAEGVFSGLRKIMQREGVLAFWKGNGTSVLHRFPYSALNFGLFEECKPRLRRALKSEDTPLVRLIAGGCAGAGATVACYPLDLVRTRLATQHICQKHESYSGIVDALTRIGRQEGMGGLYRGLGTTLFVQTPSLALSYCTYGSLKDQLRKHPQFQGTGARDISVPGGLLCGALSGIFSSIMVYPLDVVRRRMQIEGLHVEGRLRGPVQELQSIVQREGVRGLFRGLTPELMKVAPMVCLTFFTYDALRIRLKIRDSGKRERPPGAVEEARQLQREHKRRGGAGG